MPSLDCSPLPDLSLINTRHYCSMAIQYSRGCSYNCEFCDIIEIYGRKPRTKSVKSLLTKVSETVRSNPAMDSGIIWASEKSDFLRLRFLQD